MPVTITRVDLAAAIRQAQEKADKADASETESRITDSQVRAAEGKVKSAEAQVTRYELSKQEAQDKLSPPPTKEVSGDGKKGGTKTVVDEREKDKLESQVRAADVQIQQAKAAVEAAKEEAEGFRTQSLTAAGVSQDQISQMGVLDTQITQLKNEAERGGTDLVGQDYQDRLKTAVTRMGELSGTIPDAANKSLEDFWKNITTNLTAINNKITQQTTPAPVPMPPDNNYKSFYDNADEGFNTIKSHLTANGASSQDLLELDNMRRDISTTNDIALIGLTDGDRAKMQSLLQGLKGFTNRIAANETVTMTEVRSLGTNVSDLNGILGEGGSNFDRNLKSLLQAPSGAIEDIRNSLIDSNSPRLPGLANDYLRFKNIFENPNKLSGLSEADSTKVTSLRTNILAFKDLIDRRRQSDPPAPVNNDEINAFADSTHSVLTDLYRNYDISEPVGIVSEDSGSGGSSNNQSNNNGLFVKR